MQSTCTINKNESIMQIQKKKINLNLKAYVLSSGKISINLHIFTKCVLLIFSPRPQQEITVRLLNVISAFA